MLDFFTNSMPLPFSCSSSSESSHDLLNSSASSSNTSGTNTSNKATTTSSMVATAAAAATEQRTSISLPNTPVRRILTNNSSISGCSRLPPAPPLRRCNLPVSRSSNLNPKVATSKSFISTTPLWRPSTGWRRISPQSSVGRAISKEDIGRPILIVVSIYFRS